VKPAVRAFWINLVLETEDKMRSRRGADMAARKEHPETKELAVLFRKLEHQTFNTDSITVKEVLIVQGSLPWSISDAAFWPLSMASSASLGDVRGTTSGSVW
jgi:hypothetical protein